MILGGPMLSPDFDVIGVSFLEDSKYLGSRPPLQPTLFIRIDEVVLQRGVMAQ